MNSENSENKVNDFSRVQNGSCQKELSGSCVCQKNTSWDVRDICRLSLVHLAFSPHFITDIICFSLKVPYYTVFHQYIIGLKYIQNMSLKCLAPNTKQIIAASHNPLCFSPVSKVLIHCL